MFPADGGEGRNIKDAKWEFATVDDSLLRRFGDWKAIFGHGGEVGSNSRLEPKVWAQFLNAWAFGCSPQDPPAGPKGNAWSRGVDSSLRGGKKRKGKKKPKKGRK